MVKRLQAFAITLVMLALLIGCATTGSQQSAVLPVLEKNIAAITYLNYPQARETLEGICALKDKQDPLALTVELRKLLGVWWVTMNEQQANTALIVLLSLNDLVGEIGLNDATKTVALGRLQEVIDGVCSGVAVAKPLVKE